MTMLHIRDRNKYKLLSIIQARVSSQRLPGKVLLKLGDSNVIGQVIKRARMFSDQVVICTSKNKTDDQIEEFCLKNNIECFRGSLNNVFSRFMNILDKKQYKNFDWFARLTADNPLVSVQLSSHLRDNIRSDLDYLAYSNNQIVIGSGIEIVNKKSFMNIKETDLDDIEKEHVTLKLYETKGLYKCKFIKSPLNNFSSNIRLTLDYKEDYELLEILFNYKKDITNEEAIEFLSKRKDLLEINKACLQKKVRGK